VIDGGMLLMAVSDAAAAGGGDGGGITPFFSVAGLAALATLAALEIVLGIDNVVFIAIVAGRLPEEQQARARTVGLGLAAGMRVLLLLGIFWVLKLTEPLFTVSLPFVENSYDISGKDLILLLGGLFLIGKSVWEIRHQITPGDHGGGAGKVAVASFAAAIGQIVMLDLIFSLDSVITAAGMTDNIAIMITAVLLAVGVMLVFAGPVSRFVERHPEMKILALAFLILIGVLLLAEGLGEHFNRGYVYFAMGFALAVDLLQMRVGGGRGGAGPRENVAAEAGR